jgi:hypothetical protein
MAEQITRQLVAEKALVLDESAVRAPTTVDRTFELPTGLYVITAALFLGFIAVMGAGFANPKMILPLAIFTVFVVMFFAVPAQWARMKPGNTQKAMSWTRFKARGIMTLTGHSTAGAATVQVLILPALIFLWGIAAVTIAALVR